MKHLNFFSKSSSRSCGHSSVTLAATVGSPSAHRRSTMLRLLSVLVLVLTFGVGNAWGATTLQPSSNPTGNPLSLTDNESNSWTFALNESGTLINWNSGTGGVQVGSKTKSTTGFTVSSSAFSGKTVTQVVVNAKTNGSGTVAVQINGSAFGGAAQNLGSDFADKTFTGSVAVTGSIAVIFNRASSAGKNFIMASITVTYSTGGSTTYTVTYNKNNSGASGTMTDPNSPYAKDATVTVLDNAFTAPVGYTFDHWNTAEDDSGASYDPDDTFTISAATTLYAQWKSNAADKTFKLVTNLNQLSAGKNIVVVAYYSTNSTYYAMSTDRGNNRLAVAAGASQFTMSNENAILTTASTTTIEMLTLTSTDAGYYGFQTLSGDFLYAGASNGNQLKTYDYIGNSLELDEDAKWKVQLEGGVFSVAADQSSNRNVMRFNYNSNNPTIFNCYASASNTPVLIYVEKTCEELGQINGSVNMSQNSAALSWELSNVQNGGLAHINSWKIEYKKEGDANWTIAENAYDKNATSKTITNLICNSNYSFRVSANVESGYCDVITDVIPGKTTKYTITLTNSGSVAGGTFNASPTSACSGDGITLTATPATGYNFTGWSITGASPTLSPNSNTTPATFSMPAANVTVNASFAAQHHNVVFHKNDGGEDETSNQDFTYGVAQNLNTISTIGWSRANYNFGGWMTASNGSSADKLDGASYILNSESDVNLYALWVADNTRTISYSGESHITYSPAKPTTVDIQNDNSFSVSFSLDAHYSLNGVAVSMGNEALDESLISYDQESLTVTAPQGGFTDNISVAFTIAATNYTVNWFVNGEKVHDQTGVYNTDYDEIPSDFSEFTDCSEFTFLGWKEGAIDGGSTTSAPSLATVGTKIIGNKNYHAVFAEGTPGTVTWTRVTSVATLLAGGTFIMGYETDPTDAKGTIIPMQNTGTLTTSAAGFVYSGDGDESTNRNTIDMSSVSSTSKYEITVAASEEVEGAINIKFGENFLGNENTKNNAKLYAADAATTAFTPTVGSNDAFSLEIVANAGNSDNYKYLKFNTDVKYPRFAVYKTTSENLVFYKKTISNPNWTKWYTTCPHVARVNLSAAEVSNGSISFEQSGSAVTNVRTDGGEDVEVDVVPDPATGYELTGVALSGTAASHASYDAGVITIDADAEGALTATATFAQKNYSVTMEQRGGAKATLSANQTNKHYNDLIEISTTEPDGYEFGGWFIYDATDTEKENDLYESIFTGEYETDYNNLTAHFYMPERDLVALAHFDKIYSVSEFAALSKTDGTKYLVEGIVSSVQGYYSSEYITYFISVDGKNENTLKIYNGLDEGGEKFSALTDLKVGDKVRVYGAWSATYSCIDDSYLTLHTVGAHASYEIAGNLTQDVFVEGATFLDSYMANLKVNDVYNTGYKVEVDDVTFSANKTTLTTTDEVVHVTATKNASTLAEKDFTISVSAATMVSFELKEGYKTSYFVGQTFVKPTVVATLSDNSHVEAEATACTGYNMSAADTYDVTVSFTYGTTTLNNVQYQITVRTIANDLATAYTASEAKDIIENVYASTTESDYDVYVSGIAVGDPNKEGTYFISNDGSASNQVQIYKGKYFDSSVSAKDNVKAGDELVVKGHILVYSNAAEMKSTTVVSQVREGELDVDDVEEFEVGSDDLVAANLTINRHGSNGAITFSCDENSALEIVENGTKLHAKGTAIADVEVTATMAEVTTTGVINFTEATTTFNVHVVPVQTKYTISFDSNAADGGAAPEAIADKAAGANVTLPANTWTKTGYNFDGWKVTYVDGDEVVHEVTITANAFAMPAFNVTIQAQWAEIPVWAYTYTSNVDISGAKVKFHGETTEYDAVKAGTDKVTGSTTITVPAQATKLHFHAYGWKGETVGLTVTAPTGVTVNPATEISINSNTGMTSNSPFTLAEGSDPMNDAYYVVSLSGNDDEIELTISATSGKRFVLFGVNQEGGIVPELDHIEITGELNNKDYELGDNLDTEGLTVTAYYTLAGVAHHSEDVTSSVAWSYDPLTGGQTSVDVTATYESETDTKACAINAVVVPEPEIILSVSELAFSGKQYTPVADKTFDVQLKNVGAATIALSGDDASKFSIDETGLTANGTITVSANTDAAGTFIATITVSDNAHDATSQTVALTLTVGSDEAPAWNAEWVEATELYDGMPILITGMKNDATYAMGAQGSNNRAAVLASIENGVLTPGAGTKQFTLEKQSNGTYAIKTTDGKYLYAASSSNNWLRTQENNDDNGKWTLTVTSAEATGSYTHKKMQFNGSSLIFACYTTNTTTQADIKLYTPKTYTRTISGNIGTICLPYRVEEGDYFGATFYRVMYKKGDPDAPNYVQLEEVGALEAGRPYIFVPDDRENTSVLRAVYRDKEAVANSAVNDTENHGLYGTFTQVVKDGTNEIIYILNNNTIRRCGTNCTVGANKAYIMMEEVPAENEQPASAPGRRQMSLLNGDARPVATGIEDIQSDVQCTKIFYDGQIYILRGDKMYDVTGKLVK